MTTVSGTSSATGVLATLKIRDRGEQITVALSGTYDMVISFEKELGSPGSGAWEIVKSYTTENATVSDVFTTKEFNTAYRLNVTTDDGGTVTYSYADGDKQIAAGTDDVGTALYTRTQRGTTEHGSVETSLNIGTNAATSVREYGHGADHVTVLTISTLSFPSIGNNVSKGVGDLIYTFPTGAIILESSYINLDVAPAGAENDAIVGDLGLGTTIATGAVALLDGTPGFQDIHAGVSVLYDDATNTVSAKTPTVGGPMFIATGDDHTVHVNTAAAWASSSAQTCTYTGTVVLIWKFLE